MRTIFFLLVFAEALGASPTSWDLGFVSGGGNACDTMTPNPPFRTFFTGFIVPEGRCSSFIYPSPGPPNTIDILLLWDGGSYAHTDVLNVGPAIVFMAPIPVVSAFTTVELQVVLRDYGGQVLDSASGMKFSLDPVPEPSTW